MTAPRHASSDEGQGHIPGPVIGVVVVAAIVGCLMVVGILMWRSFKYRRLRTQEEVERVIEGYREVRRDDDDVRELIDKSASRPDDDDDRRGRVAVSWL